MFLGLQHDLFSKKIPGERGFKEKDYLKFCIKTKRSS